MEGAKVVCIFRSTTKLDVAEEWLEWRRRTEAEVTTIPGYLGHEGFRDPDTRRGVTIAYFADHEAAPRWRANALHAEAQAVGRDRFYERYEVEVAEVVRSYAWPEPLA